jgi:hypothetical protein
VLGNLLLILTSQLVLFFYLIFFVNLRGAIESMIEALAIEQQTRPRVDLPSINAPVLAIAASDGGAAADTPAA